MIRKFLFIVSMAAALLPEVSFAQIKPVYGCDSVQPVTDISRTSIQGNTPLEIHRRFANLIEQNFRTGDANNVIHHLSGRELADLSAYYGAATNGQSAKLLNILAKKVDADGLTSIASAFGQQQTAAAVSHYAPRLVALEFARSPPKLFAGGSRGASVALGGGNSSIEGAPTTDMSLYEIYLEFRTAPVGSLSVTSSLSETAIFAGSRLVPAAAVGSAIGTAMYHVISTYDPALDDAIGGTISNMIDNVSSAVSEAAEGKAERAVDALFSLPVSDSDDPNGDYGNSDAMGQYEGFDGDGGGGGNGGNDGCA